MVRILGNIFRSTLYLAMGGLMGYYNYQAGGLISVLTAIFFFALGVLMVTTWRKKPNVQFEQLSVQPSSDEPDTAVSAAEGSDMTVKGPETLNESL